MKFPQPQHAIIHAHLEQLLFGRAVLSLPRRDVCRREFMRLAIAGGRGLEEAGSIADVLKATRGQTVIGNEWIGVKS